jgi:hypothetical protein
MATGTVDEPNRDTQEPEVASRLAVLLNQARESVEPGFFRLLDVGEMLLDTDERGALLEQGQQDVSMALRWLKMLHERAEGTILGLEFLANPTPKTLRAFLEHSGLNADEIADELAVLDNQLMTRQAQLERPAITQFGETLFGGTNYPRAIAAVLYESGKLGMTEIGRRLGQNRSNVYAAVRWFRGLPEPMRAAITRALRDVIAKYTADEVLPGPNVIHADY